ncbi:response regulator transcription factor [Bacillus suaedae]|uniref:Response regulator transcription factor n=1 Tax=Halalkalibacter suaedae TaxID=2822140 RepID=A0A940X0J7_9BACI|nr:response regulator transcription factor [Bacillus suaedae]MBP3952851.1 response regulator transcription factor [Bacillus suaedae]
MWRVVIVDDDHKVLRGMKKVIPWSELNCQWVGEAHNGQEGMDVIKQTKPDIIITDIYMPVMNGLEMIEKIKEETTSAKVIILSGFNDFEYARQAMRLRIADYLSKPASIDTIKEVLVNVIEQLKKENEEKRKVVELQNKLETYKPMIDSFDDHLGDISKEALTQFRNQFLTTEIVEELGSEFSDSEDICVESMEACQKLSEAIRYADGKTACHVIDEFFDEMVKHPYSRANAVRIGIEMWTLITYSLHDIGIRMNDVLLEKVDLLNDLSSCKKWPDLRDYLSGKINQICEHHHWDENTKHKQLVEQMIDYVNKNLSENITLQDIANELYISRNYLGQIFKNIVGESFKNYMTRARMEKAKKMIQEGNYLIYEVSEKVGYVNPAYFTTTFKKYTGYTPTDLIHRKSVGQ